MTDLTLDQLVHDLRNELTGVMASLELLAGDAVDDATRALSENALHSAQRMAELIKLIERAERR